MEFDRRTLLIGLAGSAAMLALPRATAAAFEPECFAASRKDDRGNFSASLFTLEGDVQAIELPGRGHDIALGRTAASGSRSRGVPAASALLFLSAPARPSG